MTDTPQTVWMREYAEKRDDYERKVLYANAVMGLPSHASRLAEANDALAALDAHVRTLVEENGRLREAVDRAHSLTVVMRRQEPEYDKMAGALLDIETVTHRALHADYYAALAAPKDAP